jgi:hypothetical protein
MKFRTFITDYVNELIVVKPIQNKEIPTETNISEDAKYFNMINPDTGLKYDIPLLSQTDGDYYFKYVYYMKLKERSPETFNKILNWS